MSDNNNCSLQAGEISQNSINELNVLNFHYEWIINDIRLITNFIDSPIIFSNGRNTGMGWRMKIQRHKKRGKEQISLMLCLVSNDTNIIQQFNCRIQLLSAIPKNTTTWTVARSEVELWKYHRCLEKPLDDILDPASGFLQDGNITLICEIFADIKMISKHAVSGCTLHDDVDHVFDNRKVTDVTLCVSGKEFQAHKAILACQSPVFNAMFEHEMIEKKNSRVDISDIDAEVFEEMLRFIYSGTVINLENFFGDLLYAAKKYGLENLIALCEEELCRNISIENITGVLILADLFVLDQLKGIAIKFICTHAMEVVKTDGWASMIRSHPDLVTEAFCYLSQRRYNVQLSAIVKKKL